MPYRLFLRQARAHHDAGRVKEAVSAYGQALGCGGDKVAAVHHPLAIALFQAGQIEASESHFRRALALDRRDPRIAFDYANMLRLGGRAADAVEQLKGALERDRGFQPALHNLILLLMDLGREAEALPLLRRLVGDRTDDPQLGLLLARALRKTGHSDQAASYLARMAKPARRPEFLMELGLCLRELAPGKAADAFSESLKLPGEHHFQALMQIGWIAEDSSLYDDAAKAFGFAVGLRPEDPHAIMGLVNARRYLADFEDHDVLVAKLRRAIEAGAALPPMMLTYLFDDPALQREAARRWAPPALAAAAPAPQSGGRIRIGYVSADFRDHAVAQLIAEILELQDRSRFEIVLYSHSRDDGSAIRARVMAAADAVVEIGTLSDLQAAERIRADNIHVAMDLMGFTKGARLGIFAHRAAPLQVGWLGYPGTVAAPYMDYIVADPIVIPPGAEPHYDEAIVRLPCMLPSDRRRPIPAKADRAELGLPEDGVVLACLNNASKIMPERVAAWAEILNRVPEAVLWLKGGRDAATANLRASFAAHGISPDRLVFAPRVSYEGYLAYFTAADLVLDTFPYGGHTTASDALWCGCPVLTQIGLSFPSRVAASLLASVGMSELAVEGVDAFIAKAVELARDRRTLAALRSRLESGRQDFPLFDSARFAQSLDAAFAAMVEQWRQGEPPRALDIG